jgi:hypothetical protein
MSKFDGSIAILIFYLVTISNAIITRDSYLLI